MKRVLVVLMSLGLAWTAAAEVAPPRLGPPPPLPDPVFGEELLGGELFGAAEAAQVTPERAKEVVIRYLGLTEAQKAEWNGMLGTLRETLQPLREQLKGVGEELAELLKQNNPSPILIGELVLKGKGLREQMSAAHQRYLRAFEGMLTIEQKAKLAFLRRAQLVVPLLPAFHLYGLLPPLPR